MVKIKLGNLSPTRDFNYVLDTVNGSKRIRIDMNQKSTIFKEVVKFIKRLYPNKEYVPLHYPCFMSNEWKYVEDCLNSTHVSSVGEYVNLFEEKIREFMHVRYAVITVNGTAALHIALKLAGVEPQDEVLTQPVTFVATVNAISYCGAKPIFIDCEKETLSMSPSKLAEFIEKETYTNDIGFCYNKSTKRKISACVPVHTFGHPAKVDQIIDICNKSNIAVVEDAAEALGSIYKDKYTGSFGKMGIFSFNGNKTITTGSGGAIICNDEELAKKAKHITTTAKVPHRWEYIHDEIGFNYRLPNINAAIGCAQMENLQKYIDNKRELAEIYKFFFNNIGIEFFCEKENCRSNYWLNTIIMKDKEERDLFLEYTNNHGVMTRPLWRLMNKLDMYKNCQTANLDNAYYLEHRLVNIPSSVRI